jgi:phage terminase large subunit
LPTINLPNNWQPRSYQRPLWDYLEQGGKRALGIWHRRAGKDDVLLNRTAVAAFERVATYWTALPEYEQARKALWAAINPHTGKRRIDEAFPRELRATTNEQEMFIRFVNGSTWQLVGSDRYNSLVGAGVAGVTFSEWALCNPAAWGYIRPMLEENGGWAAFITTPRGDNHAKAMFERAQRDPEWFAQVLTVQDTGAMNVAALDRALGEYQDLYGDEFGKALFDQEYYCSFSGALIGAIWGGEMARAEREGRIKEFEIDWDHPVHTAWDLGKAANNPIWCFQVIAGRPRIVDFYLPDSDDLSEWVRWLNDRGYRGNDYVPHDILVTEWGSKRTRYETLKSTGRNPVRIPMVSVADGWQAGRATINAAQFRNTENVLLGINGLRNYRRQWDEDRRRFSDQAHKDWAEHIGSSFRYLSLAWREVVPPKVKEQPKRELVYEARPDGSVLGNMSVREAVEAMVRKRRGEDD